MNDLPTHPTESAGTTARILLAEDDVVVRSTCSRALLGAGYSVETVTNGIEAWDALRTHPFDLLVTDNHMPRLSGEELILKVRQAGMIIPIIGITASEKFFSSETNERLAETLCLKKPFDTYDILSAIRQLLDNADRRQIKPSPTNPVSARMERMNRSDDRR